MKHVVLLTSTLAVLIVGVNAINDSIATNFTADITEFKGSCKFPSAIRLAKNISQYEGRWYGVYVGFTKKQSKTLSCFCWDLIFDEDDGSFDLFFYLKEKGELKVIHAKDTPIFADKGMYKVKLYGEDGPSSVFNSTLYYISKDILSLWDGNCEKDNDLHYHELITGIRDLTKKKNNQAEIDHIYASISKDGIPYEKHKIIHENCDYPPVGLL